MAEIRMHLVGEIERRSADRHVDDFALGRQHVHTVLEQLDPHAVEEIMGGVLIFGSKQRPQLVDLSFIRLIGTAPFLVAPMRRDAALGMSVHVVGADLDFDRLVAGTEHRGMNRAVHVVLRGRDVVVELAGNERPERMHDAERRVAVRHRAHQDARRADIHDLLESQALHLHFAPDAEDVLRTAVDLSLDPGGA